ncbi:hypothetical protein DFP73DRAFT_587378 [Morchella snyderi]|nr:hypothetical protein DFP73DRAFT_587378 [Morchella snyderi]
MSAPATPSTPSTLSTLSTPSTTSTTHSRAQTPTPAATSPLASPTTFYPIPYSALTTPEKHLLTTHARLHLLHTGTRLPPATLATWFAARHAGRLPPAAGLARLTAQRRRKRLSAELTAGAWAFIVASVERTGARPAAGEVVAWLAAREGRKRRWAVVRKALERWERGVMEGLAGLSDSGGEGEEGLLAGVEGGVLERVAERLEMWCGGEAGVGRPVGEAALRAKAGALLAEMEKEMRFPPGWVTQWRLKHGIRTAEERRNLERPEAGGSSGPADKASTTASAAYEPAITHYEDPSDRGHPDFGSESPGEKKKLVPGHRDLPIYVE